MDEKRMTITELAELLNVHYNTIRQWENQFDIKVPRSKDTQRSRYYTEKEIALFTRIKYLREEKMSIDNIKRSLDRSLEAIEQEETAIEALPFSEITAKDVKELLANIILEREEKLREEFKNELKDELEKQEKRIIEQVTEKHLEQIQEENEKLRKYISESKEQDKKKGFFNKFFNK